MHKSFLKKILYILTLMVVMANASELENQSNENTLHKVSIHAEDTHQPSILSILAEDSGYYIVTGPNVQSKYKLTTIGLVDFI